METGNMSYDIYLREPQTWEVCDLGIDIVSHGGMYVVGGTSDAWLNVTYNYSKTLYRVIPDGIRSLYGKTGKESIPILENAISQLGDETADSYWTECDGNVKKTLKKMLAFAKLRPDGVWDGD